MQKKILLAALAIFWVKKVNQAGPVSTVAFWGERESATVERISRSIVTLTHKGPALQENCADYTKFEVSKAQAMEENGTHWSSQEIVSENMTSSQECKMCCKDKWNNLLSMSRVNRTKATAYVEILEIKKNFQKSKTNETKQYTVKGWCRNTAVEIFKDKLHKHLSGMTNV